MDLLQITDTFLNDDQSWLGSAHGTSEAESVTLDRTLLAAIFTNGYVPSGVVLAKVTATGRYARYDNAQTDGRETARGLLLTPVALKSGSTTNPQGALFWHGQVVEAKLPTNHGLDAAGKAELTHIQFV